MGGWAVCGVGITNIAIHIDGQKAGDADLTLPRPDVADKYSTIPMARTSGFLFVQRIADLVEGEHNVRIVVRNGRGDTQDETKPVYVNKPVELQTEAAIASVPALLSPPSIGTPGIPL